MTNKTILLDSNALVRCIYQPQLLGVNTLELIRNSTTIYYSIVSLWELAIKHKAGKYPHSTQDVRQLAQDSGLIMINIEVNHLLALSHINLPHKDPFDNLLIAQAQADHHLFLTSDKIILKSPYHTLNTSQ